MVDSVNRLSDVGYVPVHVYRTDVTLVRTPDWSGADQDWLDGEAA